MSAQEKRNEIIRDSIPQLIKELTGLPDDDEQLRNCEQLAWSIIRNHRNLSTNSHEVRRKIEGIQEKFKVDNQLEYAEHLGRLCDEIIQHPLCVEHYEVDVHWSLLDLLLSLAFNPTRALRRNREEIDKLLQEHEEIKQGECVENETEYWKRILQEDFIPVDRISNRSSNLSSWSDDSLDELKTSCAEEEVESLHPQPLPSTPPPPRGMENIKPPEKSFPYIKYDHTSAEQRLLDKIQHSWWERGNKTQPYIESTNKEANFALEYHKVKGSTSYGIGEEPETATEYSLLREIFWMFQVPQTCKFFQVNSESISVRKNVTLSSTRPIAIASMIEEHFLPYIGMMQDLRNFGKLIYGADDYSPPNTLEHYAASLEILLEPIWTELLACERELLIQPDCTINTIISLQHKLGPTFDKLANLHNIHRQAVVSIRQLPAHISSVHLLAALVHCNRDATTSTEANLSMSLFLASVKVFLMTADTWWTEGRLDDWHNEFIIERIDEPGLSIRVREFIKNKEKSFFVPTQISKMITENSFFQLLLEHSLEAGCTLNLLYEINRIGELRSACGAIEDKLYNVFIEDVLKYVRTLQKQIVEAKREAKENGRLEMYDEHKTEANDDNTPFETNAINGDVVDEARMPAESKNFTEDDKILKKLTTTDNFLLLAFTMNMNLSETSITKDGDEYDAHTLGNTLKNEEFTALDIFEEFEQSKHILPLEEVVLNALSRILKTRIAFANSFVMRLYREEFDILKHLRNIRKIYLLEASDVMHQFYIKLFKQIESGDEWANAFLLSTQLDDIICAKFLDMSSLFRIEINSAFRCQTVKVYEAVDELSLNYNLSTELAHMIKSQDISSYNQVFRFLLKVKWGLTTLENLSFPRSHKSNIPYAPFEMIDLLMRRLEQLRFWMLFAIQSIHFHLMTHVLQSMGEQLDEKIVKCTNLKEMVTVHRSYMNTVCEHCFLVDNFSSLKLGVEQLLNLTYILRLEWNSCVKYIESNCHPLAVININESIDESDYVTNSQIDAIELTYIRCHQYLANKLNNEVYIKNNSFLLGLSTAFNTSLPY